jgi:hypothetical protein
MAPVVQNTVKFHGYIAHITDMTVVTFIMNPDNKRHCNQIPYLLT